MGDITASFQSKIPNKMYSSGISFKVMLENKNEATKETEVRRFKIDNQAGVRYDTFIQKLFSTFPDLNHSNFSVSWVDGDGDIITVASDEEFVIALHEQPGPVYKFTVIVKEQESGVKNSEVSCNSCESILTDGFHFKCVVCDDFKLCEDCERIGRHPGHKKMGISGEKSNSPSSLFKRIYKLQEKAENQRIMEDVEMRRNQLYFQSSIPNNGREMSGFGSMRGTGQPGSIGGMRGWSGRMC